MGKTDPYYESISSEYSCIFSTSSEWLITLHKDYLELQILFLPSTALNQNADPIFVKSNRAIERIDSEVRREYYRDLFYILILTQAFVNIKYLPVGQFCRKFPISSSFSEYLLTKM